MCRPIRVCCHTTFQQKLNEWLLKFIRIETIKYIFNKLPINHYTTDLYLLSSQLHVQLYCLCVLAPSYNPSYSRDNYYNTAPLARDRHRTEFTTTEYRSIYSPAQPPSQRRITSAPYQNRSVVAYKNATIGTIHYRWLCQLCRVVCNIRFPGMRE